MNSPLKPLVSVVIPTYNRAHCVGRAIASVVGQSYPSIEIIVVDDGSTDGTIEALERHVCDRPLRIVRLGGNRGAPSARNEGIAAARGEYVAFLDSDDLWHPQKIERQIDRLRQLGPDFGACYTPAANYDEQQRLILISGKPDEGDLRPLLASCNSIGSTSTFLARRELLQDVGGFTTTLRSCQDWDLWLRIAGKTKVACVGEPLTALSIGSKGRITSSARNRLAGHLYIYRTHMRPYIKSNTADPSFLLTILGDVFMQLGRPKYAAKVLYINWCAKPHSAKRFVLFLMARMRIGAQGYGRVSELIFAAERLLRGWPTKPPLGAATFAGTQPSAAATSSA